jgi:hypothetical protein
MDRVPSFITKAASGVGPANEEAARALALDFAGMVVSARARILHLLGALLQSVRHQCPLAKQILLDLAHRVTR